MSTDLSLTVLYVTTSAIFRAECTTKPANSYSLLLLPHNNFDKMDTIQYFNHDDVESFTAGPIDRIINPRHATAAQRVVPDTAAPEQWTPAEDLESTEGTSASPDELHSAVR